MAKTKVVKLNESKALSSVAVSQLSWKNRKKTSGRRRRRGITTLKALAAPPPCYVNICTMLLDAGSYLNRFFSKNPFFSKILCSRSMVSHHQHGCMMDLLERETRETFLST